MKPYEQIILADANTPMDALMSYLGFNVHRLPTQTRCPIHKLGAETKPSARIYEDNSFVWCYTCHRQYKPTEVYSAQKGLSREEAATRMLSIWPVPNEKATQLLKEKTSIKKPVISEDYQKVLERKLQENKRKIPYEEYRSLAKRFDEFRSHLGYLPTKEQESALWHFLKNTTSTTTNFQI
jgi:hypothetical protein